VRARTAGAAPKAKGGSGWAASNGPSYTPPGPPWPSVVAAAAMSRAWLARWSRRSLADGRG
jgi:hypothetical protein